MTQIIEKDNKKIENMIYEDIVKKISGGMPKIKWYCIEWKIWLI